MISGMLKFCQMTELAALIARALDGRPVPDRVTML
jgi:hypothetical protein